jgi:tetratricopeptide (TPR) repeat protein
MTVDAGAVAIVATTVVGMAAGLVQVAEYVQSRRTKDGATEPVTLQDVEVSGQGSVIHNLPPRSEFIGRSREKDSVLVALRARPSIVCIDGIGGVGKTALALEVAHTLLAQADEQSIDARRWKAFIWISCKETALSLDDLLSKIARGLDFLRLERHRTNERVELVVKLLRKFPSLLVLDNFETVKDWRVVEFLSTLPEPSKALITSRQQLSGDIWAVPLTGLNEQEAIGLIRSESRRLGLLSVAEASQKPLSALHVATGGIPLAIKWSVGQIRQRGESLEGILRSISSAKGDIFESMFQRSWSSVAQNSRHLIMVSALLPGPANTELLAAASGLDNVAMDDALGELIHASLFETSTDPEFLRTTYSMHPMTRAFAGSKLDQEEGLRETIIRRLVGHYTRIIDDVNAGRRSESDVLTGRENLLTTITNGFLTCWSDTRALPLAMKWLLWESGYWLDLATLCQKGIAAAQTHGDALHEGRFAKELAWVRYRQEDYADASTFGARADVVWTGVAVPALDRADLESLSGLIERSKGHLDTAKVQLTHALDTFRKEQPDRVEVLRILTYLGEIELDQGHFDAARDWFQETLEKAEDLGRDSAISWSLGNLGEIEYLQGDFAAAVPLLERGLEVSTKISRYHTIANCALRLAEIMEQRSDLGKASNYYHLAADKYTRLGIEPRTAEALAGLERVGRSSDPDATP